MGCYDCSCQSDSLRQMETDSAISTNAKSHSGHVSEAIIQKLAVAQEYYRFQETKEDAKLMVRVSIRSFYPDGLVPVALTHNMTPHDIYERVLDKFTNDMETRELFGLYGDKGEATIPSDYMLFLWRAFGVKLLELPFQPKYVKEVLEKHEAPELERLIAELAPKLYVIPVESRKSQQLPAGQHPLAQQETTQMPETSREYETLKPIRSDRGPYNQEQSQEKLPRLEQHTAAKSPARVSHTGEYPLDATLAKSPLTRKKNSTALSQEDKEQAISYRVDGGGPTLQNSTPTPKSAPPAANCTQKKKKPLPVFWSSDNQVFAQDEDREILERMAMGHSAERIQIEQFPHRNSVTIAIRWIWLHYGELQPRDLPLQQLLSAQPQHRREQTVGESKISTAIPKSLNDQVTSRQNTNDQGLQESGSPKIHHHRNREGNAVRQSRGASERRNGSPPAGIARYGSSIHAPINVADAPYQTLKSLQDAWATPQPPCTTTTIKCEPPIQRSKPAPQARSRSIGAPSPASKPAVQSSQGSDAEQLWRYTPFGPYKAGTRIPKNGARNCFFNEWRRANRPDLSAPADYGAAMTRMIEDKNNLSDQERAIFIAFAISKIDAEQAAKRANKTARYKDDAFSTSTASPTSISKALSTSSSTSFTTSSVAVNNAQNNNRPDEYPDQSATTPSSQNFQRTIADPSHRQSSEVSRIVQHSIVQSSLEEEALELNSTNEATEDDLLAKTCVSRSSQSGLSMEHADLSPIPQSHLAARQQKNGAHGSDANSQGPSDQPIPSARHSDFSNDMGGRVTSTRGPYDISLRAKRLLESEHNGEADDGQTPKRIRWA